MRILIHFICVLFSISLFGQAAVEQTKLELFSNPFHSGNELALRVLDEIPQKDRELLFAFDDWMPGKVTLNTGEVVKLDSVNLRRDVEQMQFVHDDEVHFLYANKVRQIEIEDRMFSSYFKESENEFKYYEVLSDGPMTLYKHVVVKEKFESDHPMGITHNNQKAKRYTVEKFYYYDEDRQIFDGLPKKKKKVISLFRKGRNKLIDFAQSNNISLNKEEDLISFFDFYNDVIAKS